MRGFLLFSVMTLPGLWCQQADPHEGLSQMMMDCLSDEACARHLADAVSNSTHGTNATNGYEIVVEVQSNLTVNVLIWALAEELDIAPGRIRRATASTAPCFTCRRLATSFKFRVAVPDDKTPQLFVETLQQSDLLKVVSVDIVALPPATPGSSTVTTTVLYIHLPKPSAVVTELTGTNGVVPQVTVTEDIVISTYVGIRGMLGYDPTIKLEASQWSLPIFLKVVLIAWANDLLWTPPPVKANFSLRAIVFDQCADGEKRFESEFCKMPYNMDMALNLFFGNPRLGLPRSRVVIGGTVFTDKIAYLGSAHGTPMVGFRANQAELSDKGEYPSFVRTNSPELILSRISTMVLRRFGFKTFDLWFCNIRGAQTLIGKVTDSLLADGFRTANFLLNPYMYTGCPPGTECEIRFYKWFGRDDNESFSKKDHFDAQIAAALDFNAHAHLNSIDRMCAYADIFNYLSMRGLVGSGHLWTGDNVIGGSYTGSYLFAIVNLVPAFTGLTSDYVYQKPFDGSVFIQAEDIVARPQYQELQKLMKFIGAYPEDYMEPWIANKYPVEAYKDLSTGLWDIADNVRYLDSFAAALYALNEAVLKYGLNFTDAQLLHEIKTLDFSGIGRRVRFDANGDPIAKVWVTNYRYRPGFKQHIAGSMAVLHDIGLYESEMTWLGEPVFYNGVTDVPPDVDKPCPIGTKYLRVSGDCETCPTGTYASRLGQASCDPCPPGTYSDVNGARACKPCDVGTFAMETGSTGCATCGAGLYADSVQMSECKDCYVGSYSDPGATLCTLCKRGTYAIARGTPNCTQCPGHKTTFDVGGGSPDLCVCPSGTYLDVIVADSAKNCIACPAGMVFKGEELTEATSLESCKCPKGTYRDQVIRDLCYPCPAGMFCKEVSDEQNFGFWTKGRRLQRDRDKEACTSEDTCIVPVAVKGFMTRKGEPLRTFKCINEEVCPGGPPGKCGEFADGGSVACGNCMEGARKNGVGCTKCKSKDDKLLFAFAPIVLVMGLAIYIWSVNREKMMESKVALSFGLIWSIAFSTLQTMAMFSSLNMNWFEPLKSTLKGLDFLQFNPEFLRPTCAVGIGASLKFLGRQLFPLLVCITDFIIVMCVVMVERFCLRRKVDPLVDLTNSIGAILCGLFISMISNSFTPFVCYSHPDSSWSMLADASILCWTTKEHKMMVGVAVALFLIVPVPYLTVVLWATWRHSWFCLEGARGNNRWLFSFRFLFHRFNPSAYYYTLVTIARGLFICLTPVVIAKDPGLQLCILGLIIATVGLVSCSIRPWKARSASLSEAVLNMCSLQIIICGAVNEDFTPYPNSISGFATLVLLVGITTVSVLMVIAFVTRFKPMVRYDVSICCNTKEAEGQSRLLKLFLMKRGLVVCMPDLSAVDEVFDVVKYCVKNLVVFLTRSCLTQPVCAGQIAIAHRKKGVNIVGLKLRGFVAPLKEDLDYLPGYLDVTDISLGQLSIDWEMVKRALNFLVYEATLIDLTLMSTDAKTRCCAVLAAVLGKVPLKVELKKPQQHMVLIASDVSDEDATAAAGIVALTLNSFSGRAKVAEEDTYMLEDLTSQEDALQLVNSSRAVIMVLSKGSLRNRFQLWLIHIGVARMLKNGSALGSSHSEAHMRWRQKQISVHFEVLPVVINGFVHPTVSTYINFLQGVSDTQLDALKAFFERMTFPLLLDASDRIVQMQIEVLAHIIPGFDDINSGSFATLVIDEVTGEQPTVEVEFDANEHFESMHSGA